MNGPGRWGFEGMGLALLAEGHAAEARRAFEAMAADENAGARGLCELGLYERAATLAPLWAEPYARRGQSEPGPVRKAYFFKKAVELAPRRAEYWRELAQAQFDTKQYAETEKSWRTAERMAASDTERAELTAAREKFVQMRYDAEAAERARIKKEEQDEVERAPPGCARSHSQGRGSGQPGQLARRQEGGEMVGRPGDGGLQRRAGTGGVPGRAGAADAARRRGQAGDDDDL